ncbi:MAG: hypothetical protein ACYDAQ_13230 [Mycobacteriales bacterium]
MTCTEFQDCAGELALGAITGAARADALRHAAGCLACRTLLRELAGAVETLALLAPPADPSAGFESRVLELVHSLGSTSERATRAGGAARRPRLRSAVLAAAAIGAVGAALGAGVTTALTGGSTPAAAAAPTVRTAAVWDWRDSAVGAALVVGEQGRAGTGRTLLSVQMSTDVANQTYQVIVKDSAGHTTAVGSAQAVGHTCSWSRLVPVSAGSLRELILVPPTDPADGYTASFGPAS